MLAAVITARNYEQAVVDIGKCKSADAIEIRLDYMDNLKNKELEKLIMTSSKPVIITCRKYGSNPFVKDETKRIGILKDSVNLGADYIDIEYDAGEKSINALIKNKKSAKIIVSYHNFKETPSNIAQVFENIKKLNPDLIKIATNANSVTDNFKIFELINAAKKGKDRVIAFCMGPYGQFSRILSVILGSQLTYSSVEYGKESADGQLTLSDMCDIYRIKKLSKKTRIAGLIGNPVEHSWSHIMHNAAFDSLGIDAVYLKFKVDKLKEFIEYFKKLNILGFSVTIPHKIEIIKYLDSIDKKAKAIGAVNTVAVKNGQLIGHNTDCDGAIMALKAKTKLNSKKAVVLGAGGSSRALTYGLIENGAKVAVLNRTLEKARMQAEYFNCDYGHLDELKNMEYDILINTIPVGMYPDSDRSPIPLRLIKSGSVVFDIIFNPFRTKLLKYAESKKCITVYGFEMLINGAALQFKLWTGKNPSKSLMRKKVMERLRNDIHKN